MTNMNKLNCLTNQMKKNQESHLQISVFSNIHFQVNLPIFDLAPDDNVKKTQELVGIIVFIYFFNPSTSLFIQTFHE
jgi:hypothetical protein